MDVISELNGITVYKINYCNYRVLCKKNIPVQNKIEIVRWFLSEFGNRKPQFKLIRERRWNVQVKLKRKATKHLNT